MANGNKPAAKYRLGYVTATVWKNDDFFNVELVRNYKDGDDWRETNSLSAGDLLNAAKLLQRSEEFIASQAK
jgi:hypothetical protein